MNETTTDSGLAYTDIKTGEGDAVTGRGQTVIVHYTGWLEDETKFDSSRDRNELKLIEDALFKISAGTYGICETCEKPINMKRLQIMPLSVNCIQCQENMERPG